MRGINKVIVIGNLGQDPEVRFTQSGTAVANVSVAVNEQWNGKDGERHERTEWIKCVLWGKIADIAKEYLRKGDPVYLEGKLQTRKWEDRNGGNRYTTEVNVSELRMLGSKSGPNSQVEQPEQSDKEAPGDDNGWVPSPSDVPF